MDLQIKQKNLLAEYHDNEKWLFPEWQIKLDWVIKLKSLHRRILERKASFEDLDLFWIKLLGLLNELITEDMIEYTSKIFEFSEISSELERSLNHVS